MNRFRSAAAAAIVVLVVTSGPVRNAYAAPANDSIADATTVSDLPFTDITNTFTASFDSTDPTECPNANSVWYVFTPTIDANIEANTFGSEYDTTLAVYSGSPGSLTQLECNNDSGDDLFESRVRFAAVAGTSYYFMVGACCLIGENNDFAGSLTFNVLEGPPQLEITSFEFQSGSFNAHTGNATIHGIATCNGDASGGVGVELRQKVGRRIITGFLSGELVCTSSGGSWTATVDIADGFFKGGPATLSANGFACTQFTCGEAAIDELPIKLRGGK